MKRTCIFLLLLLAQQFVFSQQKMKVLIDEQMKFAVEQYKVLAAKTPENKMPRTFQQQANKLVLSDVEWWTSGFYPGTLWYIYEYSKDATIRKEAEARLRLQKKVQHFTGNHDVGFMIFCSFGNAYRITGDTAYRTPIHNAAEALSTRYKPAMKAIQSWNTSKRFNAPVIIDNMMNLELLSWVTRDGGDKKYWDIAVNHANTTLANHFRPDNSCYHVVDYDLNSGMPTQKKTWQGLNDQSAWSRGQGWALYGYTMMYRFTRDKKYLEQAKKVAGFILNHPNLPADKIPYWDFDAPTSDTTLRDASAGALMASALLELGQFTKGKEREKIVAAAETMIRSLADTNVYRAALGTNGGFLLKHSVGALPFKEEVDVPLTYADYYFVEALLRYKKWYL